MGKSENENENEILEKVEQEFPGQSYFLFGVLCGPFFLELLSLQALFKDACTILPFSQNSWKCEFLREWILIGVNPEFLVYYFALFKVLMI